MNPLLRRQILWHPHLLDLDAMNQAAQGLLGLHDFAAFCKPRDFGSTIRTLEQLTWHREGDVCVMTIQAEAYFLAQRRGFQPGHELDDWLAAEESIGQVLAGPRSSC